MKQPPRRNINRTLLSPADGVVNSLMGQSSSPATSIAGQYRGLAASVGQLIAEADDSERTAYQVARLGLMALMMYRGPVRTAETAYQLADELAEACTVQVKP